MKQSSFFSLNWLDVGKAAIVAALSAGSSALLTSLDSGILPTGHDLKTAGVVAAIAGCSYLIKNMFTNSTGAVAKKESGANN